ncbi:Probable cytosolic iron-sulfur protein assembly protein Ciao1, related [Eimeria praecox]|uniref:Probable cytosolic iron-sulfur protein assembly protein Ciao1, related n=1 Tax=Eimeria praecox TaxID=51316 RepID=U6H4F9_9EIME|nr:Probable cytosolic iron-sulfur protein assembly protein Ciao1, related [Eimeria praecox]
MSSSKRVLSVSQWCVAPFLRPLTATAAAAAAAATAATAAAAESAAAAGGPTAAAAAAEDDGAEDTPQQQADAWRCMASVQGQHRGVVYGVSVHPTKNLMATACGDGHIRIYLLTDTGAVLLHCEEKAHNSDVNCVAWSPDDEEVLYLASVGDDGFLSVWCMDTPVEA